MASVNPPGGVTCQPADFYPLQLHLCLGQLKVDLLDHGLQRIQPTWAARWNNVVYHLRTRCQAPAGRITFGKTTSDIFGLDGSNCCCSKISHLFFPCRKSCGVLIPVPTLSALPFCAVGGGKGFSEAQFRNRTLHHPKLPNGKTPPNVTSLGFSAPKEPPQKLL